MVHNPKWKFWDVTDRVTIVAAIMTRAEAATILSAKATRVRATRAKVASPALP
jgi:hypothetical protein